MLAVLVLIVFLLAVARFGWCQVVYQSYFDISYFEFSVPFLLLGLFGGGREASADLSS